jgi:hypothetical protein
VDVAAIDDQVMRERVRGLFIRAELDQRVQVDAVGGGDFEADEAVVMCARRAWITDADRGDELRHERPRARGSRARRRAAGSSTPSDHDPFLAVLDRQLERTLVGGARLELESIPRLGVVNRLLQVPIRRDATVVRGRDRTHVDHCAGRSAGLLPSSVIGAERERFAHRLRAAASATVVPSRKHGEEAARSGS